MWGRLAAGSPPADRAVPGVIKLTPCRSVRAYSGLGGVAAMDSVVWIILAAGLGGAGIFTLTDGVGGAPATDPAQAAAPLRAAAPVRGGGAGGAAGPGGAGGHRPGRAGADR